MTWHAPYPSRVVKHYGNMIKHKNNQAVAYNRNGSCGACGFVICQQMRIELQLRRKIILLQKLRSHFDEPL